MPGNPYYYNLVLTNENGYETNYAITPANEPKAKYYKVFGYY